MAKIHTKLEPARLNAGGYFNWQRRLPPDQESMDAERRELWYIATAYLIRAQYSDAFMEWAEGVDFGGGWMPKPPEFHRMFLGEHGWSPASRYFQQDYFGDEGWTRTGRGCPTEVRTATVVYLRESNGYDCSVDDGFTLRLPVSELIGRLGIRWSGVGADFLDTAGQLAAFDPTAHADGPSALLLREDASKECLAREELAMVWVVRGEKRVIGAGFTPAYAATMLMSGAYCLGDKGPVGFLKCTIEDYEMAKLGQGPKPIAVIRSSPRG